MRKPTLFSLHFSMLPSVGWSGGVSFSFQRWVIPLGLLSGLIIRLLCHCGLHLSGNTDSMFSLISLPRHCWFSAVCVYCCFLVSRLFTLPVNIIVFYRLSELSDFYQLASFIIIVKPQYCDCVLYGTISSAHWAFGKLIFSFKNPNYRIVSLCEMSSSDSWWG